MKSSERLARGLNEVAEIFDVSKDSLRRAAERGELETLRIGSRVLVPESEIQRVLREGLGRRAKGPRAK